MFEIFAIRLSKISHPGEFWTGLDTVLLKYTVRQRGLASASQFGLTLHSFNIA